MKALFLTATIILGSTAGFAEQVNKEYLKKKKDSEPVIMCIQVYAPVCGKILDKLVTFNNTCYMNQAGAEKHKDGPCEPPKDQAVSEEKEAKEEQIDDIRPTEEKPEKNLKN